MVRKVEDAATKGPATKTAHAPPAKPAKGASPAGLERELQELRQRVAALEARLGAPAPGPLAAKREPTWLPVEDPQAPLPMPPLAPRQAAGRGPRGPMSGTWLALAGILVLGLGVVFFLKLAYDRGWVPLAGRYAIGLLGGLGLWALGDALRRRVDVRFAQALAAGGAIIAYVTVYVGYALPHYRETLGMTLGRELALLAIVAVALAAYALWRRWALLAWAAVALGTILLAPAGDFSTAGVLYAVFLDTAFLLAAAWRRWLDVVWVALAGANVAIAAGLVEDVHWALLVGSSLVVNGTAVLATARGAGKATHVTGLQAAVSVALAAVETGFALGQTTLEHPFGWSFLGFGLLGLLVGALLRGHGAGAAIAGAGLLLVWPGLQFEDAAVVVVALAVLGALAFAVGRSWPRAGGRLGALYAALPYWGFAALLLLVDEDDLFDDRLAWALAASAIVAATALLHWALSRRDGPTQVPAFVALGEGLGVVLVALARTLDGWAISVSWAGLGLAAVVAAVALRFADLRVAALGIFGFVLVRIFTFDIAELSVVGRVLAFLATGALLLVAAYLFARVRRQAPSGPLR